MPDLLRPDGQLLLLPTGYYNNMDFEGIRLFCHKNARYGLPTIELIDWLHEEIGTRSAIEIGAGHGDLSFHLGVPATDNYMQRRPEVAAHYRLTGQPTIDYPARVEHLDASAAIIKYRPDVVIASWVTEWIDPNLPPPPHGGNMFGVKEDEIVGAGLTYILIGNTTVHGKKKIMHETHVEIRSSMLRSRSVTPEENRVWIWNR